MVDITEKFPFADDMELTDSEIEFLQGLIACKFEDVREFVAQGIASGMDITHLKDHCMNEQWSFFPGHPYGIPYASAAFAMRLDSSPYTEKQNHDLWDLSNSLKAPDDNSSDATPPKM